MERKNNLSKNLKAFQVASGKTLAEFSSELGIPSSTVQSIMNSNNTTAYTLVRISDALHISMDDLMFEDLSTEPFDKLLYFVRHLVHFEKLSPDKQKKFLYHCYELLKLIQTEGE